MRKGNNAVKPVPSQQLMPHSQVIFKLKLKTHSWCCGSVGRNKTSALPCDRHKEVVGSSFVCQIIKKKNKKKHLTVKSPS